MNGAGIIISLTPDSHAIIAQGMEQAPLTYDGATPSAATCRVSQNSWSTLRATG